MKPVLSPALPGTYNIKNVQRADKDKRVTFSRSGEGMGGNEGAPRHEMPKDEAYQSWNCKCIQYTEEDNG